MIVVDSSEDEQEAVDESSEAITAKADNQETARENGASSTDNKEDSSLLTDSVDNDVSFNYDNYQELEVSTIFKYLPKIFHAKFFFAVYKIG